MLNRPCWDALALQSLLLIDNEPASIQYSSLSYSNYNSTTIHLQSNCDLICLPKMLQPIPQYRSVKHRSVSSPFPLTNQ